MTKFGRYMAPAFVIAYCFGLCITVYFFKIIVIYLDIILASVKIFQFMPAHAA